MTGFKITPSIKQLQLSSFSWQSLLPPLCSGSIKCNGDLIPISAAEHCCGKTVTNPEWSSSCKALGSQVLLSAFQLATCNASGRISSLLAGYEQRRQIPGDRSCLIPWICRALCTKGLKSYPRLWNAGINQISVFVNLGTPALHFLNSSVRFFFKLVYVHRWDKIKPKFDFLPFNSLCPALKSHPYGKNHTHKKLLQLQTFWWNLAPWFSVLMTHLDTFRGRVWSTAEV